MQEVSIFDSISYLDFHNHNQQWSDRADVLEIVSCHLEQEQYLTTDYYTIGKHPWKVTPIWSQTEEDKLVDYLTKPACLGLGEIGLDKYKGVDLEHQKVIFRNQLGLVVDRDIPVVIHCVRAYDELFKIKKEYPGIKKWCIHGYARKLGLAQELIKEGFYLSLMPRKQIDSQYVTLINGLPKDRFFLETDSMPNTNIENLYLQAAANLNMSLEQLQKQLISNAKTFFGK
jgi:TatD DNase family protein